MDFYFRILHLMAICLIVAQAETKINQGKECSYFGSSRVSAAEGNLVNCSWYAEDACCRRTEVTSVFGSMPTLEGASDMCANMFHYLMCYFCSPQQHVWYHGRVEVCGHFCRALYDECRNAKFAGVRIGTFYGSGEAFCKDQAFSVLDDSDRCFDFDPTVFSAAPILMKREQMFILALVSIVSIAFQWL